MKALLTTSHIDLRPPLHGLVHPPSNKPLPVDRKLTVEDRWCAIALFVVVAVFVLFKAPYLGLPYYWDEAWVYQPAAEALRTDGPGLLPTSLKPDLSRGHPLLFHALAATWGSLVGNSPVAYHAFALFLSCLLLLVVYGIGRSLSSARSGLCAAVLLVVHEPFLAQSGLLLPEVMVASLTLLTTYAFWKNRPVLLTCATSGLLLTKESGLVVVLALCLWSITLAVLARDSVERNGNLRLLGATLLGMLPLGSFVLMQRQAYGWYLYPEHLGLMSWSMEDLRYKVELIHKELFDTQGAQLIAYTFGFVVPLLWMRSNPRLTIVTMLLFTWSVKALYGRWPIPNVPALVTFSITACGALVLLLLTVRNSDTRIWRWLGVCMLTVVLYVGFCALNFYSDRYLLMIAPLLMIAVSILVNRTMGKLDRRVGVLIVACIILARLFQIGSDGKKGDTRLVYANAIKAQRELIQFCVSEGLQDSLVACSFMTSVYLTSPSAGYLQGAPPFRRLDLAQPSTAQLTILTSDDLLDEKADVRKLGYQEIKLVRDGEAWAGLYRRPTPVLEQPN